MLSLLVIGETASVVALILLAGRLPNATAVIAVVVSLDEEDVRKFVLGVVAVIEVSSLLALDSLVEALPDVMTVHPVVSAGLEER